MAMDPHVEVTFAPRDFGVEADHQPVIQIDLEGHVENEGENRRGNYGWNCCDEMMRCASDTAHSVAACAGTTYHRAVAVMDEVAGTLIDYAEVAAEPILAVYTYANNAFTETGRSIGRGYAWIDREVVQLSREHLSPELAEVAIRAFRGVPFAAAYLVLPAPVVGIGCTALFISSWIGHRPLSDATYRRMYDGWGMGVVVRLGVDTTNFLATGSPAFAIAATINLITAAWLFNKASNYQ